MKNVQAKELVNPRIETIGALGLGVLIVYVLATNKSGADLAIFMAGVAAIYTPIKRWLHVMFQQTSFGVERLQKILSEQPSVREASHPKSLPRFTRKFVSRM